VVGWSYTPNGETHAFVTVNGVMTDLGTFGGRESYAYDINDAGQVVGSSKIASEENLYNGEDHAFVMVNGVMTDLGRLGWHSWAYGINNAGQVVGVDYFDIRFAFITVNGVMTDLGTLGGDLSYAYGINNAGQVVGWSRTASGEDHAFVTVNGVMTDLGTLGGDDSWAWGINDAGQVVGWSKTASGEQRAFVTIDGVMTDLNALLDPADAAVWTLSSANAINDAGQIAASGGIKGKGHAVLLTPVVVPLPAAICLMGSALLGFVGLSRGKDSALARG
jgi:probable HAF family extracellular repeat protein